MTSCNLLLRVRHGSHLYGLARPDSDLDHYEVWDNVHGPRKEWGLQVIVGEHDTMRIDLHTWLQQCAAGVPQALEAMFAPPAAVEHDLIGPLRAGYRVGSAAVARYEQTIWQFLTINPTYKRRRHALRYAFNGGTIARTGRFNPQLTPKDAAVLSDLAHSDIDAIVASCWTLWGY